MLDNSSWIWASACPERDEYAEFREDFVFDGDALTLRISADSDYAVYVNGVYAASGQYGDFEYWKIADEIDLSPFCERGNNTLAVVVWYWGETDLSVYRPGKAGVIYELIAAADKVILSSGEQTRSRISSAYKNHYRKEITMQLGKSFLYDSAKEDDWMTGTAENFAASTAVDKPKPVMLRPISKLAVGAPIETKVLKNEDNKRILFDLGREYAGYIDVDIESDKAQTVAIAFGEHIADGGVRRFIGSSDFSVEVGIKNGRTVYMNPFRRVAARYLELFAELPVKIRRVSLRPTDYPLNEIPFDAGSDLRRDIYRICVNTLRLCMHDHYEDCPWREQALYAMDSRNQMLCGYYAFGETAFPRASLQLMAQDRRYDDLLTITVPCGMDLCIPSFSMHYITAVREYYEHSDDLSLLAEVWDKLKSISGAMIKNMGDGMYRTFAGSGHWNFYESGISGSFGGDPEPVADLIGNCLFVLAMQSMAKIAGWLGCDGSMYAALARQVRDSVNAVFCDRETGLYFYRTDDRRFTVLGNSLAILSGAATGERAKNIARTIADADPCLQPTTLSMACFKYDALLMTDRERYRDTVLSDIERHYSVMLEAGSTTVWEDSLGESAYDGKGSLCHGWSALPVYYFHLLCGA